MGNGSLLPSCSISSCSLSPIQYFLMFKLYWYINWMLFQGSRYDSSNYNPVPFWLSGAQMVSLNFQTPKKWLQINQGWFLQNGGYGYVLKPNCLIQKGLLHSGHKWLCLMVFRFGGLAKRTFLFNKGQTILKANYGVLNFSKN